jgi:hypothetical protein
MTARHVVAAAGALIALLGVVFTLIDSNTFATSVLLLGLGLVVGGLWQEIRPVAVASALQAAALARAAFSTLVCAVSSWRASRRQFATVPAWPDVGDFAVEVVGESMYQPALAAAAGGQAGGALGIPCTAMLVPEPTNPADANAISVQIGGRTVGYLSRPNARSFRARLESATGMVQPTSCGAIIRGGGQRESGETIFYGVWLDLDPL